jgi:MSHA biogenesis protein MshP
MRPDRTERISLGWSFLARQRGFSIISAIFLLVVLAGLGAAMVTFSTTQHITASQDLQGSRAYQAARAGMEWGLYQVLTPVAAPGTGSCFAAALPLGGNLNEFAVQVDCALAVATEGSTTLSIYTITSRASAGAVNTGQFVEREVSATVSR